MNFFIEAVLLAILLVTCIRTSVSDISHNIISNKTLLISAVIAIPLNAILYIFFEASSLTSFAINFAAVSVISFMLYALHIWAAGDCKLFLMIALMYPSSFYWDANSFMSGSWWVAIYSILLGYAYIIIDSICKCIQQRKLLSISLLRDFFKGYFKRLVICFIYTNALWVSSVAFWNEFYNDHNNLFAFASVIIAIAVSKVEFMKRLYLLGAFMTFDIAMMIVVHISPISWTTLFQIIVVILLLLLEIVSEQFDYAEIPVEKLKKGMILSSVTTMQFIGSKVDGLPSLSTEDLQSRLTSEEVKQISEWSNSKTGQSAVIIVRKIPFAIFLTFGLLIYFLLRYRY